MLALLVIRVRKIENESNIDSKSDFPFEPAFLTLMRVRNSIKTAVSDGVSNIESKFTSFLPYSHCYSPTISSAYHTQIIPKADPFC